MALTDKLKAIADAIRGKTGKTAGLTLEQMATEQDAVFDAGKKAYHKELWDDIQTNGTRTYYYDKFSGAFGNNNFYPLYDFRPTNAEKMFRGFGFNLDLAQRLEECGVVLDLTNCTNVKEMFFYAYPKVLPPLVFADGVKLDLTFGYMGNLETADITVNKSMTYSYPFSASAKLKNLTVRGTIGNNGFSIGGATLTHDSIMSIINALETKTSGTWSVSLGATNLAQLTDAEKAIATGKGWTLA